MNNRQKKVQTLPFRVSALTAALLMFSGLAEASGQLIANNSTQSIDGDYATSGTGSAGYALWATNNGQINSTGAASLSISSALSSAIVAQSGGKITLGGNGLGRFNVTSAGNGGSVLLISGANSQVSLSGADVSINLGTLATAGNAYGASLTGNAALNLTGSTVTVSADGRGASSNVYGIRSTGGNNRITLNDVTLAVSGSTSSSYSESTFGIALDSGSTLTGNNVTATVSSSSSSNSKAVLDVENGGQATLSNINFTGNGPVVGGVYAVFNNSSATLNSGTISVNKTSAYNAGYTGTINAYDVDVTSGGSVTAASSNYGGLLNLVRGSLTTTATNASALSVYQGTAKLQDVTLTMKYGATNNTSSYLLQVASNGLIDANHITANVQTLGTNGAVTGISAISGGQVKLYNGSQINLNGYTANYISVLYPSYGALISGANSALIASDSTIAVNAPRDGVVGVRTQNGGSATLTNMAISTSGTAAYSYALVNADAASSLSVTSGTVSTSGGLSQAVFAQNGSLITLNSTAVSTAGGTSPGIVAMGGSTVQISGGSVKTTGGHAFGLGAVDNTNVQRGTVVANGTTITTLGNASVGAEAAFANTVSLSNASIDTSGTEAYGLFIDEASSTVANGVPQIVADHTSVTTHGSSADAAVVNDGGSLILRNQSSLYAQGAGASALSMGTQLYGVGGVDYNAANQAAISDSTLESASAAAISIAGRNNILSLSNSTVTGDSGLALAVQNGIQDDMPVTGNLTLTAANSVLNGAITTAADGSSAYVTLNNGSQWNVAGNSNMTHLTLDSATVHYNASATLGTNITLGSGGAVFDTNGYNAIYSGTMDGSGSLTKNGLGTFTLTGINALGYGGDTTINAGVLALRGISGADASSLSKTITLNGGWLDLSETAWTGSDADANDWQHLVLVSGANAANGGVIGHDDKVTYDIASGVTSSIDYQVGKADGDANGLYLVKSGDGTLVLNHANEYKGFTRVDGGVLQISADNNLGDTALSREVILNGGNLQITAALTSQRALELRQSGSLIVDSGVSAVWNGGVLESGGSFDLTKSGDGTLVLGGAASQSGATIVNSGILQAGAANLFNANDSMQIASGAVLALQSYDQQLNNLSGNGQLQLGSASAALNNSRDTAFDGLISGSGNLTKTGNGTLTLGQVNTYTGDTQIATGTLKASVDNIIADSRSVTVDSVFDVNSTVQHVNQLSGSGQVLLGSGNLTANNDQGADTLFAGVISGSGALEKTGDGMLVLNGENVHSGGTTVSGGILQIGNGSTSGSVSGDILNNAQLGFNRSDDTAFDGIISGSGNVYKAGGGALTLNNVHTYTGETDVREGTLIVGDDTHSSARLASSLVNVAAGATFGGYGSVAGDVNNQGTLAVADAMPTFNGGASGDFTVGGNLTNSGNMVMASTLPNSRLIVQGNYIGNGGTLTLSTVLGDDNSATDKLMVQGNTSGDTSVIVNGVGNTGAQTVNGIRIIEVGGASDGVFTLTNRVVAGPFEYNLFKGTPDGAGGDWYLRSQQPGGDDTPQWRPEVGGYLSNQYLAGAMQVHTLFDRQGAQYSSADGSVWGRVIGGRTHGTALDGQVDETSDYSLVHIGGDLAVLSHGDQRLHLGAMGSWGSGSSDASAHGNVYKASSDIDGYNLGLYATWYEQGDTQRGAYVDSWLQYGWYNNQVKGDGLQDEKYDSRQLGLSLEAGYTFRLDGNEQRSLNLTPQLQAVYGNYRADDHVEANGSNVTRQDGDAFQTRLGVRVSDHGIYNGRAVQPYAELNWWHAYNGQSIAFNGIDVAQDVPKDRVELKAGLQGQISKNWSGWAQIGLQSGGSDYRQVEGAMGVKFVW